MAFEPKQLGGVNGSSKSKTLNVQPLKQQQQRTKITQEVQTPVSIELTEPEQTEPMPQTQTPNSVAYDVKKPSKMSKPKAERFISAMMMAYGDRACVDAGIKIPLFQINNKDDNTYTISLDPSSIKNNKEKEQEKGKSGILRNFIKGFKMGCKLGMLKAYADKGFEVSEPYAINTKSKSKKVAKAIPENDIPESTTSNSKDNVQKIECMIDDSTYSKEDSYVKSNDAHESLLSKMPEMQSYIGEMVGIPADMDSLIGIRLVQNQNSKQKSGFASTLFLDTSKLPNVNPKEATSFATDYIKDSTDFDKAIPSQVSREKYNEFASMADTKYPEKSMNMERAKLDISLQTRQLFTAVLHKNLEEKIGISPDLQIQPQKQRQMDMQFSR